MKKLLIIVGATLMLCGWGIQDINAAELRNDLQGDNRIISGIYKKMLTTSVSAILDTEIIVEDENLITSCLCAAVVDSFVIAVNDSLWFDYASFFYDRLAGAKVDYEVYFDATDDKYKYFIVKTNYDGVSKSYFALYPERNRKNGGFINHLSGMLGIDLDSTLEDAREEVRYLCPNAVLIGTGTVTIPEEPHKPNYTATEAQKNEAIKNISEKFKEEWTAWIAPDELENPILYINNFYSTSDVTDIMYEYDGKIWSMDYVEVDGSGLGNPIRLDPEWHALYIERMKESAIYRGYVYP